MKQASLKLLKYWMEERQRIYLAREAGNPFPWSTDKVFQSFRFCCVYRENDKVTKWIRENWREPYADHPNLWFAMAVARQINLPSTLEAIGFPDRWEPKRVLKIMRDLAAAGKKVYSGAYMLTAGGGNKGVDKPSITVDKILTPLFEHAKKDPPPFILNSHTTLETAWDYFMEDHYGFGPFMSYEVVTDLRHTKYLRRAKDIQTWANPGPGARRGLNYLYDRDVKAMPPREQLISEMKEELEWLKVNADRALLPTLEMRDAEHVNCEVFKYIRVKKQLAAGTRATLDLFQPPEKRMF